VVCDPRKNALLKEGNKSDKIDARKLFRTWSWSQFLPTFFLPESAATASLVLP
jgi:hypothetical protein